MFSSRYTTSLSSRLLLPPRCVAPFVPERLSVASADLLGIVEQTGAPGDDAASDALSRGAVGLRFRRRSASEVVDALLNHQGPSYDVADVEHGVDEAERSATGSVRHHVAQIASVAE